MAHFLKINAEKTISSHPLTLTFAVGGAGAQKTMAGDILVSLKKRLLKEELHLNLVAGVRNDVYLYFKITSSPNSPMITLKVLVIV